MKTNSNQIIRSKVLKHFTVSQEDNAQAEVILCQRSNTWDVYARFSGGGYVNGFTFSLDAVTDHTIHEIAETEAIKEMSDKIIELANMDVWEQLTS